MRENMQSVPSAGKHAISAKRGKTCNPCQARENMQSVPNAGKHAISAKRGKSFVTVSRAGKYITRGQGGQVFKNVRGIARRVKLRGLLNCAARKRRIVKLSF